MKNSRKVLYAASTFGHLASFHKPYLSWLAEQGVTVHAAAGGKQVELPGGGLSGLGFGDYPIGRNGDTTDRQVRIYDAVI